MPTPLDNINNYKTSECQLIYDHINNCKVCQQLYAPPGIMENPVANQQDSIISSTWIIFAILIIFIGIFIYQKFILK